jgi:hypothetical protein
MDFETRMGKERESMPVSAEPLEQEAHVDGTQGASILGTGLDVKAAGVAIPVRSKLGAGVPRGAGPGSGPEPRGCPSL